MKTFKHYNVYTSNGKATVFDPRCPAHAMYVADSFADAKRWINAYRDGVVWAVFAVLPRPAK